MLPLNCVVRTPPVPVRLSCCPVRDCRSSRLWLSPNLLLHSSSISLLRSVVFELRSVPAGSSRTACIELPLWSRALRRGPVPLSSREHRGGRCPEHQQMAAGVVSDLPARRADGVGVPAAQQRFGHLGGMLNRRG